MDTIIFVFPKKGTDEAIFSKEFFSDYLNSSNFKKIGLEKENAVGFCIMFNRKEYFEIDSSENPNIFNSSNFSDIIRNIQSTNNQKHQSENNSL